MTAPGRKTTLLDHLTTALEAAAADGIPVPCDPDGIPTVPETWLPEWCPPPLSLPAVCRRCGWRHESPAAREATS